MATFTGTNADETITPSFVSPTVKTSGGTLPSDAADIIDAGGGNDMIDAGGGYEGPAAINDLTPAPLLKGEGSESREGGFAPLSNILPLPRGKGARGMGSTCTYHVYRGKVSGYLWKIPP